MATPTGIELIDTIHEELLKSCELTGIWEKKLRDIEHKTYDPAEFINGLKEQINQIVIDVLSDNSSRRVTIIPSYEDLGRLCSEVIGPEMARLGCICPEPGYCYTIEHGGYKPENIDIEYCVM